MGVTGPDASVDEHYMRLALEQAQAARSNGEVPVGCVIVQGDLVIARGSNAPIGRCDPTAHAEILAMRDAAAALGNYRITGCTLYVTLEPCAMCAGAMVHARLGRLVFGATDPRVGAAGSALNLVQSPAQNHRVEITGNVLAAECAEVLLDFFRSRRAAVD